MSSFSDSLLSLSIRYQVTIRKNQVNFLVYGQNGKKIGLVDKTKIILCDS